MPAGVRWCCNTEVTPAGAVRGALLHLLARQDRIVELRAFLDRIGGWRPEQANWSTPGDNATYAELAVVLGDRDMAQEARTASDSPARGASGAPKTTRRPVS